MLLLLCYDLIHLYVADTVMQSNPLNLFTEGILWLWMGTTTGGANISRYVLGPFD